MKRLVPMFDNSGARYSIPEDRVDEFRADMGEVAEARRYRDKDGRHYTIPQDQDEAFRADMPDAVPVRSYTMADGTRRDFTMSEMSKFLRSKEYRESEDYTPPQMGSVAGAAVKGALAGAAEGAYYGGKNAVAKVVTALPEAAASVGEAVGNVINLGGNAKNAVGDWLRESGRQTKRWLGENIRGDKYDEDGNLVMSGLTKDLGYEDTLTKIGETAGDAAAMAVKFAPAAVAGPAYIETILASDGINAFADTFDRVKAAGYSDAQANLAGTAAGLINYYGAKLMMKGGAATKDIANPLLRALAGTAFTGAATGAQAVGNKGVENVIEGKPITEGMLGAAGEGFVEGAQFHLINEVGTNAKASMQIRRETREMKEMRKENLLTATETPDGRAFLNTVVQNEGVDAAIRARKEGKDVSRRMGAAADLPDNMSAAERNAVIDGIAKARDAQAERVRTKMDDVQAQSLADEIGQNLMGGASDPMFEDIWLNATRRVKDATELDEPGARARIVGEAISEVAGREAAEGGEQRKVVSFGTKSEINKENAYRASRRASLRGQEQKAQRKAELDEYERQEQERIAREKAEQDAQIAEDERARAAEIIGEGADANVPVRKSSEYKAWLRKQGRIDTDKNFNRYVAERGLDASLKVERGHNGPNDETRAELEMGRRIEQEGEAQRAFEQEKYEEEITRREEAKSKAARAAKEKQVAEDWEAAFAERKREEQEKSRKGQDERARRKAEMAEYEFGEEIRKAREAEEEREEKPSISVAGQDVVPPSAESRAKDYPEYASWIKKNGRLNNDKNWNKWVLSNGLDPRLTVERNRGPKLPEKPTPPELRVEERKKPVIEADLTDLSKKTAKVDKETGENAEIVATNAGKTDKRDISHSSHLDIYTPGDAPGGVEGARIVKSVSGKTGEKKFQIVLKNGESIDVGPVGKNGKFGIRKGDDIRGPFDTLGNAVRKANELYGGEKKPAKVPDGRGRMVEKKNWRTSKVDEVDADGKPYTEAEKMQLRQDKAMTFIDETFKDSSRKNLEAAIKAFEDIESEGGFGKDSSGASPVSSVRRVAHQIATSNFATPEEKARFKEYYEGNPQPSKPRENAPSRAPQKKGITSRPEGAERTEGRNNANGAASMDEVHKSHYEVVNQLTNLEDKNILPQQRKEYYDALKKAREERDSVIKRADTEELIKDFNEQFGGNPPTARKGFIDYYGKYQSDYASAIMKEIESRGYKYNKKTGYFDKVSPSPRVPDGKGRMVNKQAPKSAEQIADEYAAFLQKRVDRFNSAKTSKDFASVRDFAEGEHEALEAIKGNKEAIEIFNKKHADIYKAERNAVHDATERENELRESERKAYEASDEGRLAKRDNAIATLQKGLSISLKSFLDGGWRIVKRTNGAVPRWSLVKEGANDYFDLSKKSVKKFMSEREHAESIKAIKEWYDAEDAKATKPSATEEKSDGKGRMVTKTDGNGVYEKIANAEPPIGLHPKFKKQNAAEMAKIGVLAKDGKMPVAIEGFDGGASKPNYVEFKYADGSSQKVYGDINSIKKWADGVGLKPSVRPAPTAKADGEAKTKNSIVDADTARTDENWGFRKATNAIEFQEQMDALENYENHLSLELPEPPINPKTKRPYGKNTPQYKEWAEKRRAANEEYKREVDRVKKLIGEESEHWGTASEARAQEIVDKAVGFDKKKLSRRDELEYDNTKIELENAFDEIPLEELRELTDGYGNISRNGIGELSESQTRLLDAIEAVNRFHEQAGKYQRLKRDADGRPIFQISEATPAQKLADPDFKAWARKQGRTPTDGARRIYDAQRVDAVFKVAKNWLKGVKMRRSENAAEVPQGARMSIGNLYTGSAADYEKPSLLKVGTGEGSQVYGWGLYASDQRGIADNYAEIAGNARGGITLDHIKNPAERMYAATVLYHGGDRKKALDDLASRREDVLKRLGHVPADSLLDEAVDFARKNVLSSEKYEYKPASRIIYEQTFFTNRAPSDESHLLKWYEPVSEENWKRIISEARKEFDNGSSNVDPEHLEGIKANFSVNDGGRRVYEALSDKTLFGSPQAASEFLARADIDGIKYPVDSYGGKTVKDGDKAGWNYVSFRDDNITVDHKWVDGKIRYLYSRDGNVVGWYDRAKKELVTLPGADAATVAHELGWHATYDYAQAEAAQGRTALLDKLNDYAANAPQSVKNEILRKYGMATDAAVLLDEIGAARYTMDNVNKIKDAATRRQTAKWYQRTWNAIADTYKAMLSKMGWNKARLDNLSALTPEETVNLLADEMLKGRNLGKAKSTQIDMSKGESIAQLHDRKLKDRLRPIEEIEKDAGKSVGNSAYTLFRTLPGKVQGAIDKAQNFAEKVKADCKKAGIKIEELNEFLYASAASERNAKVLARNGRLDGSAMSHADIQRILSAYRNSPKYAELRRIADDVLAFQRKGFDFRRKAGLISDETWNTLLADEPNHVPMKNRFDPNGEHMGFSLTEQFGKPEWKTAEGRTNVGDGPLEWIVQEYVDAFSRGHENVARRALLETVLAHPEVGEVKKLGPNDALGEVKRKGQQGDPNVFVVKTDGDTYQVKLNGTRGELIARAVSGRGLVRAPQSLQKAMRWWSSTATSWSPTFAVRNFLSDTVDVFAVNIGEKGLIKGTGAFGKHVKTALKLTNAIRKYASTGETTDPLIREAVDAGVLMGGGVRSQAFADAGEAALKTLKTDWRNGKNRVKAVRDVMFGWIDTLNQTAELMNRMADYKLQMESLSKANNALPQNKRRSLAELRNEAALHAREITVDFNQKGELTPVTNMLYMFSNSTLGATMRLGKAIFASKEGKSLAAGTFALGLIEGAVEAMANGDDEDGKNMNEYTRANSFYFRKGKDIYRIPLHASPISVIKYAGNCTARKLFGTLRGDKAAEQIAKDMIGMMTSFLGIGALGDNEAASIAPTIIQPFLQAYMNRDFADRPIERMSFSEEKPKSGNGRPSTPQYYHDLAKWLNEFGGGNAGRKGEFLGVGTDFSPEMLKHFNEATGKNALRDIENTVEFVKMVLRKTDWDRRNIPVGRDYFRTTGGNDNRFFEAVRAYKTDASDFKERTGADRKKFEDSHPWLKEGRDGRTTVNRLINMTNRDKPRDGIEKMGITQLRKLTEGKIRRNDGTYFKPNTPVSDELKEKAKEWLQKRQARVIEIMGK